MIFSSNFIKLSDDFTVKPQEVPFLKDPKAHQADGWLPMPKDKAITKAMQMVLDLLEASQKNTKKDIKFQVGYPKNLQKKFKL